MKKVRIGDTVIAELFGGERVIGKVEEIEICRIGEKEGRPVRTCDMDKHRNGVLSLDCDHWCYFYQVVKVL